MLNLTLEELFGIGAYQDENYLVIPSQYNNAEQILASIISKALDNYQGIIVDENSEQIEGLTFNNQEAYQLAIFLWRVSLTNNKILHQFIMHQRNEEN